MRPARKLEIGAACVLVPLALQLLSAQRTFEWIRRLPRRRVGEDVAPERLAYHVDRLLRRAPAPWHHTCLRRATVLAALLRRGGRDAEVVLGVRRAKSGTVEAHAWLRCDGVEPYLEPGDVSAYTTLRAAR